MVVVIWVIVREELVGASVILARTAAGLVDGKILVEEDFVGWVVVAELR
jgi:hypothetical protein